MEHAVELMVHTYLDQVTKGKTKMKEESIRGILSHLDLALHKQFTSRSSDFRVRASNIGRAPCQLWYQKNKPEAAAPRGTNWIIRMLIGDITEAVFKAILTEAGVAYKNSKRVKTEIGGETISGEFDLVVDGKVDDIKSASPWSYKNKWIDGKTVSENDSFGYIGQLTVYAKALGVKPGGWWVINHNSGEFKYIKYESDTEEVIKDLEQTLTVLDNNIFERCFEPVKETFRKKDTGNYVLNTECKFCDFKEDCWKGHLSQEPSRVSKAKEPALVWYVDSYA